MRAGIAAAGRRARAPGPPASPLRKVAPQGPMASLRPPPAEPTTHAAAGDPLQGHDAERLVVARGDDQDAVLVEQADQLLPGPRAQEVAPDRRGRGAGPAPRAAAASGPSPITVSAGRRPSAAEPGQAVQQDVHPLVRDQPAHERRGRAVRGTSGRRRKRSSR